MKFFRKHKFIILSFVLLILGYFLLRLPNLVSQPIFADEAIYIRWAQVMKSVPSQRFISLQDGKTPLFMWVMIPFLQVLNDPLFAGRLVSVFAGVFTLFGIYMLAKKIFNAKVALLSALIYMVCPYTIFFDRMALVDSMLAGFTIWIIYFAMLLLERQRIIFPAILGTLLGGALLVKTPALMNILALPVTLVGFNFEKSKRSKLFRLIIYWGGAAIIALGIYSLQRVDPNFHQLSSRNGDYLFSLDELKNRPLDPLIPHLKDTLDIFSKFLTVPIFTLVLLGSVLTIYLKNRRGLVLLLWALIPIFLQATFLKTFTARYILLSVPMLLILAGYGLSKIGDAFLFNKRKFLFYLFILIVLLKALNFDYLILTDVQKAPLPVNERKGYLEEWTAGYGFAEIAEFAKEHRKKTTVVIGTEGFFGTLPEGLRIYLDKTDIPFVTSTATVSAQIRTASIEHETYFVANRNRLAATPTNALLIKEYLKATPLDGTPQDAIVVYQVFPDKK